VFAELLAHPGVTEELELRGPVGFLAFHGGSLEQVTDTIARAAAARSGSSLYAVVQPPDLHWHIPSKLIDPEASPSLRAFLDHVEVGIALHGYGRANRFLTLLLGGTHRPLAAHTAVHLRAALTDGGFEPYEIVDELDDIPLELRGLHPDNPVNRVRGGGVQIELPPRVRGLGPYWAEREGERSGDGLTPHTEALIDGLARAATTWPVNPTAAG
jgi:phage replication-related protein YjqB (UPF0714/DUF867 family)